MKDKIKGLLILWGLIALNVTVIQSILLYVDTRSISFSALATDLTTKLEGDWLSFFIFLLAIFVITYFIIPSRETTEGEGE